MKKRPIRHPEARYLVGLRDDQNYFGPAARAVFDHAEYTFRHFVEPDGYRWTALACLHKAGIPLDALRRIAKQIGITLDDEPSPPPA